MSTAQTLIRGLLWRVLGKLRRIVQHFRAHLDQAVHEAPRCNAPWVSAVIEASGDVRPCFFHPVVGNIHRQPFQDIVNGPAALQFRADLDVASNAVCQKMRVLALHSAAERLTSTVAISATA